MKVNVNPAGRLVVKEQRLISGDGTQNACCCGSVPCFCGNACGRAFQVDPATGKHPVRVTLSGFPSSLSFCRGCDPDIYGGPSANKGGFVNAVFTGINGTHDLIAEDYQFVNCATPKLAIGTFAAEWWISAGCCGGGHCNQFCGNVTGTVYLAMDPIPAQNSGCCVDLAVYVIINESYTCLCTQNADTCPPVAGIPPSVSPPSALSLFNGKCSCHNLYVFNSCPLDVVTGVLTYAGGSRTATVQSRSPAPPYFPLYDTLEIVGYVDGDIPACGSCENTCSDIFCDALQNNCSDLCFDMGITDPDDCDAICSHARSYCLAHPYPTLLRGDFIADLSAFCQAEGYSTATCDAFAESLADTFCPNPATIPAWDGRLANDGLAETESICEFSLGVQCDLGTKVMDGKLIQGSCLSGTRISSAEEMEAGNLVCNWYFDIYCINGVLVWRGKLANSQSPEGTYLRVGGCAETAAITSLELAWVIP